MGLFKLNLYSVHNYPDCYKASDTTRISFAIRRFLRGNPAFCLRLGWLITVDKVVRRSIRLFLFADPSTAQTMLQPEPRRSMCVQGRTTVESSQDKAGAFGISHVYERGS